MNLDRFLLGASVLLQVLSYSHAVETILRQADFEEGTFRITEPGTYKLEEDIVFGPQATTNDYWPPHSLWHRYPPAAYYLGFFAAITIEADDVTIDLNGKEIRQSREFYLVQRFYNNIQLNNRIFVSNEGVSSLNYQKTDKVAGGPPAGNFITPKNVKIMNGVLGLSSHAGIHGNSIEGLHIAGVTVKDFEVAGIQCNGCNSVKIESSEIGPGAQDVPVLGTFSSARFLQFFTDRLIPSGFAREPEQYRANLLALFDDTITFADRPGDPLTISQVFSRNNQAVELFRKYYRGDSLADLTAAELELLEEAKKVFENKFRRPDGSSMYGIFLNRRGVPAQDDNFNGAGKETFDIQITDVLIHDMSANPIEVPSLMTEEGAQIQGPARDLLRIYDISSDRLRTILDSQYKGNFLSDVYFAMWQLSNSFYNIRVFTSNCGNFGSNASFPVNLNSYPSENVPTCADAGSKADPNITGREVTMLQKRYFGGLQMTQGVYDWATTPLQGLDSVLARPARHDLQRAGYRHMIVCDHDTMFHPMHGVVGLKIVEATNVDVQNVTIKNLHNSADREIWTCSHQYPWQLQPSGEDIRARTADPNSEQSSMVRAVEVVRSNDVLFEQVKIMYLTSEEGSAVGLDLAGDGNDRTDYEDAEGVTLKGIFVDKLTGPGDTVPLKTTATPFTTKTPNGISVGQPDEIDYSLGNPRMIMNYQMVNARSPRAPGDKLPALTFSNEKVLAEMKVTTTFNTDEKLIAYRRRVLAFYSEHYGMVFDSDVDDADMLAPLTVYDRDGNPTDSIVQFGQLVFETQYHATSLCINNGKSEGNCTNAFTGLVHDYAFSFFPGPSGYTFHGAFGGDAGKFCPENNIIWVGVYSFENVQYPGVVEGANLQVEYYGECPTPLLELYGGIIGFYINCAVESDVFGKGMATGAYFFEPDGEEWVYSGYPSMIFDDHVVAPENSPIQTSMFGAAEINATQTNDWHFSFIADGSFRTLLSGVEAVVYGHMHHYTHEAGLDYLNYRTSVNTDQAILDLRKRFLTRLADTFGIDLNPDDYDDIPLDGVVDLGGGNLIMAYVVNEDANLRIMTKRNPEGKSTSMPPGSRMHEGGFRFVVGRSGIVTAKGRIPFGSIFQEGVYVIEDPVKEFNTDGCGGGVTDVSGLFNSPLATSDSGTSCFTWEINFHSIGPSTLNGWTSFVVYQALESQELGDGELYATYAAPENRPSGLVIGARGVLVFGNTHGSSFA